MITIVKPLTYGRMGNFLFQAAAAMGYAWRNGIGYTLPNTTNDPQWNPIYLQQLVREDPMPKDEVRIEEGPHTYQALPFKSEYNGKLIILDGYWQSERYFAEYRECILQEFGFRWKPNRGVVAVHVRRGDYLTIQRNGIFKHPPVPKEWLLAQMAKFPGMQFAFFSDDIAWCKENFKDRVDCHFCTGKSEQDDLIGISCCEHQICSASTFSWWGAWLNRNPLKRIIIPKHWLTPGWGPDCSDIVPANWERA